MKVDVFFDENSAHAKGKGGVAASRTESRGLKRTK